MTVTVCVRPCARGVGRRSESESAWGRGHGRGRAIRDEWTLWRAVVVVVVVGGWDGGVWLKPGSMTLVPRNPAEPHDTMALFTALSHRHVFTANYILFAGHRKSLDSRRYLISLLLGSKSCLSLCLDFAQSAQTRAQVMSCLCSSLLFPHTAV